MTTHRPWDHDEIVGLRIAIMSGLMFIACVMLSVAAATGRLD
jgi:hypothetical protein